MIFYDDLYTFIQYRLNISSLFAVFRFKGVLLMAKKEVLRCFLLGIVVSSCAPRKFNNSATNSKTNPNVGSLYKGPEGSLNEQENLKLWNQFCTDKKQPNTELVRPVPNYENLFVKAAEAKLNIVEPQSFSLYSDIMYHYKSEPPAGKKKETHDFLSYLCGEFRDRATMIQAKLVWVSKISLLPTADDFSYDAKESPWTQLTTRGYLRFINISNQIYTAREELLKGESVFLGQGLNLDKPVPAFSQCEIKYIMKNYVFLKNPKTDNPFPGIKNYETGFKGWSQVCSQEDKDTYLTFRGDSNIKPNSPESNGMIFHARSIASRCTAEKKAKSWDELVKVSTKRHERAKKSAEEFNQPEPQKLSEMGRPLRDEECKEYFEKPFQKRWIQARAGLGTWMLHSNESNAAFENAGYNVTVFPHSEAALRPLDFRYFLNWSDPAQSTSLLQGNLIPGWQDFWLNSDLGITNLALKADANKKNNFLYERLRNAVNRHTNWYAAAFNDGGTLNRDQAYSPFVASSYEMSKSDGFTAPGVTVKMQGDGKKHWMFIFKVKKSNWYTSQDASTFTTPDFEKMWFDERSLGTESLAKEERAWDRLGTAMEDELESVLYLHNIDATATNFDSFMTDKMKKKKLKIDQLNHEEFMSSAN